MKKHVCITTIWTKVVEITAEAFRGTKHEHDFMIYHDALVLLTAKTTIEWLKTQYYGHRSYWEIWIHPMEGLNAGTRFKSSPVGNSK